MSRTGIDLMPLMKLERSRLTGPVISILSTLRDQRGQHALDLEFREVPTEAEVRPAAAESDVRIGVTLMSNVNGSVKTDSSRFADE